MSAPISELGNVIERVDELREQDSVYEEGSVIEQTEVTEGMMSEGNVMIIMDEGSRGES